VFIVAMGFSQVDILGFSIGSFVAQQIVSSKPMPGNAGWSSSRATESRKLPVIAVTQQRTIAWPSPAGIR
jgi:hypothetical protein